MEQKTIVVKCGGNASVDQAAVCRDVAALAGEGWGVVLVHGGSADVGALAERLGLRQRKLVAPDAAGCSRSGSPDASLLLSWRADIRAL
ncbi:hypothetical protein AB0I08_41665, partial [Streptomyces lavendulae]